MRGYKISEEKYTFPGDAQECKLLDSMIIGVIDRIVAKMIIFF